MNSNNPPFFNKAASGFFMNSPLTAGLAKASNIAQRVASAKRLTMMDLKSKIKLLQDEVESLRKENRLLTHLYHRQDNALRKWEGKDAALPRLLNQHRDEIRSLQEQLRRAQHQGREITEKINARDKKIIRLESELEKLRLLVHEEQLQERHTLQQDLDISRMNLVGAEKRIGEYMRHVDILEKNYRHQLAAQNKKLIKVNTSTYELQHVVANLRLALRNKDRMLNYIQMRSSGRTLIRAYHADKSDRVGNDMSFFGGSIATDITSSFKPTSLLKSQSFDFGRSRCSSPPMMGENSKDKNKSSPKRRSLDNYRNPRDCHSVREIKPALELSEKESRVSQRPRSSLSHSHSMDSIRARTPPPSRAAQKKTETVGKPAGGSVSSGTIMTLKTNFSGPTKIGKSSDKKHFVAEKIKGSMSDVQNVFRNVHKVQKSLRISASTKPRHGGFSKIKQGPVSSKENSKHESKLPPQRRNRDRQVDDDVSMKSEIVSKYDTCSKVSRELIYQGSTAGFKYEGPFVSSMDLPPSLDFSNRESTTEILYSSTPRLDNVSCHSLGSSGSSSNSESSTETSRSSTSEIMSNIGILSARIMESCVRVPPPEEALNSPRNASTKMSTGSSNASGKPCSELNSMGGPAGDNNSNMLSHLNPIMLTNTTSPVLSIPSQNNGQMPPMLSEQNTVWQPIQIIPSSNSYDNQDMNPQSPRNSPRLQPSFSDTQNMSGQVGMPAESIHYHLPPPPQQQMVQPGKQPISFDQVSDVNCNNQFMGNTGLGHTRMNDTCTQQVCEPQGYLSNTNPLDAHHPQSQTVPTSPRFPVDYSFVPYVPANFHQPSPASQNPVAIVETIEDHSLAPSASLYLESLSPPMSSHQDHQQSPLYSNGRSNAAFPVGYYDPNDSSSNQGLPSLNSGNSNKSAYNPSYYMNLGSWK